MTTHHRGADHAFRVLGRLLSLGPGDEGFRGWKAHRRLRALYLLAQGHDQAAVARMMGITRQAVNRHARLFQEGGALTCIRGSHPHLYKPGKNIEAVVAAGGHHRGWSRLNAAAPVGRVHAVHAVVGVQGIKPGARLPERGKSWTGGKGGSTRHQMFRVRIAGGRRVKVRLDQGPKQRSMTIYLCPKMALGEAGLEAGMELLREEAAEVMGILEGRHGFMFTSPMRLTGRPEVAFPSPGLSFLAGQGIKNVAHVDTSAGIAETEAKMWALALAEMRYREAVLRGDPQAKESPIVAVLRGEAGPLRYWLKQGVEGE